MHKFPNCSSKLDADGKHQLALSVGGHYNPYNTGKNLGSKGGDLGDLPVLIVLESNVVWIQFYLKDIKPSDFKNRLLMI